MVLNHLDLFAGIGGFSLALRNIYKGKIHTEYSEIDKYAEKIFLKHFPEAKGLGDVRTIRPGKIGHYNLITFGFPCQDLSIAGRRMGIEGKTRSSLFFEAIRIIDKSRPEYFIAENVKGFFSSHNGKDFLLAIRSITDIGYDCQWQLLNTKWFLPQNRERVFIVGHLREITRPQIFPIGESNEIYNEREAEIRNTEDYRAGCIGTKNNSPQYQFDSSTTLIQVGNIDTKGHNSICGRIYDPEGIATTLKSEGGGLGAKTGLYAIGYTRDKKGKRTNHLKKDFASIKPTSGANSNQSELVLISDSGLSRKKEERDIAPPLRSNTGVGSNNLLTDNVQIRRLTPTECERLQGFPDGYTEGISDTQRYKTLGNAISVPVVEKIFKRLYAAHT